MPALFQIVKFMQFQAVNRVMNLVGVISSDEQINKLIETELEDKFSDRYQLMILAQSDVLEFLNFDLPEIVIINFTDSTIDVDHIVEQIRDDSWLHNFGIIGLFDQQKQGEVELLSKLKNVNILALLNYSRIRSHIAKSIQIIDENRQIIFQSELSSRFFESASGSFTLENDILASSIYASIAATTLAQRGYINPESKMLLQLSLGELLINAIEHGNCGITFEEKSEFLDAGHSVVDLVAEKCEDPDIEAKTVYFEYDIRPESTKFLIRDEGKGFDVTKLNAKIKQEGPMSLHGRGIKMAASLATKMAYNKKGNEVLLIFPHEESVTRDTPIGFSEEEVVDVSKGDIIFREGETSNFLYYITSGKYSVFAKAKHVGMLTPADIFMGEMSFLLNNRRSATVRAEGEGRLVKIPRKSLVAVIKDYPHYGLFLSKLLARKLARANIRNVVIQQQIAKKIASTQT